MALAYLFAMTAMVLTAIGYGRMAAPILCGSAYTYARKTLHPMAGFVSAGRCSSTTSSCR